MGTLAGPLERWIYAALATARRAGAVGSVRSGSNRRHSAWEATCPVRLAALNRAMRLLAFSPGHLPGQHRCRFLLFVAAFEGPRTSPSARRRNHGKMSLGCTRLDLLALIRRAAAELLRDRLRVAASRSSATRRCGYLIFVSTVTLRGVSRRSLSVSPWYGYKIAPSRTPENPRCRVLELKRRDVVTRSTAGNGGASWPGRRRARSAHRCSQSICHCRWDLYQGCRR
jgi:hypothetical protein